MELCENLPGGSRRRPHDGEASTFAPNEKRSRRYYSGGNVDMPWHAHLDGFRDNGNTPLLSVQSSLAAQGENRESAETTTEVKQHNPGMFVGSGVLPDQSLPTPASRPRLRASLLPGNRHQLQSSFRPPPSSSGALAPSGSPMKLQRGLAEHWPKKAASALILHFNCLASKTEQNSEKVAKMARIDGSN
eukprot:CAMPEP_0171908112 /NCGR_PEP_ID=MMETSP0993-20121228/7562_1 /TAXON_ID=483369 /ORGANISM="non described non described, Strain CCMP2098" /LENGTH=188 /DNA_ID=CAMNT_0012540587 /DNA_START=31 /DNA_END=598 /DNA_ORIENTATION=-